LAAEVSIPSSTITTSVIDEPLKEFVISRQKSLAARINADIANLKGSVKEKQLMNILSSDRIQDEQVNHVIHTSIFITLFMFRLFSFSLYSE
jgi:hypothetical protein